MSSGCFNYLPTELLVEVFGYLESVSTRRTVSSVCTRWSEIMSNFRLLDVSWKQKEIYLEQQLVEKKFSHLKRCRAVVINTWGSKKSMDYDRMLAKYFFTTELVENLTELDIRITLEIWEAVFLKEQELRLPNLKKICIRDGIDDIDRPFEMRCQIVAPKLRSFYQEDDLVDGPLRFLNDQITELAARYLNTDPLLAMIDSVTFGNLRSLIVTVGVDSSLLRAEDLSVQLVALFGRLEHLKIVDWQSKFSPVYSSIIRAAKNLKCFELYGKEMTKNDFMELNTLQQLTHLTLMIRFEEGNLSLPKLNKLKILYVCGRHGSQLSNVPSLKSVAIEHDPHFNDTIIGISWKSPFHSIVNQLQSMELCNVILYCRATYTCPSAHKDYIQHGTAMRKTAVYYMGGFDSLFSLQNLLSLKLKNVEAEFNFVEKLLQRLKKLRFARFENCCLAERIYFCVGGFGCECFLCDGGIVEWEPPVKEQNENFFENLAQKYKDCGFAVQGTRFASSMRSQIYH